jgi:DNA modification methylase
MGARTWRAQRRPAGTGSGLSRNEPPGEEVIAHYRREGTIFVSDDVSPHNKLNDLSNREWIIATRSFWEARGGIEGPEWLNPELMEEFGRWLAERRGEERAAEMLGQLKSSVMRSIAPPRDGLKATHPATFSERDVARLIEFFTKRGQRVLDPFVGSGSTLLAAADAGRVGLGVELIERWLEVAAGRLEAAWIAHRRAAPEEALDGLDAGEQVLLAGDARAVLAALPDGCMDFMVTSPPYWRILRKRGLKAAAERETKNLPTHYSEDAGDLGNLESYEEFLAQLGRVFAECARLLRVKGYACVIVSDFRHGPRFHLYHADVARLLEEDAGLQLKGLTVLIQDSKNLYPLGVPNAYVPNIHHQFVLIAQRMR